MRKILLTFVGLGAAGIVAIYLLTIPLLRRLPKQSRLLTHNLFNQAIWQLYRGSMDQQRQRCLYSLPLGENRLILTLSEPAC